LLALALAITNLVGFCRFCRRYQFYGKLTSASYARTPASLLLGNKLFDVRKAIPISNSEGGY